MDDPRTSATICTASVTGLDPVAASLLLLGLVLAITTLSNVGATEPTSYSPPALATINPNTAPWWELMVLPDIGESTACKIVEYRDAATRRQPVFQKSVDLEAVPGIGPKTIQRINPNLRFTD